MAVPVFRLLPSRVISGGCGGGGNFSRTMKGSALAYRQSKSAYSNNSTIKSSTIIVRSLSIMTNSIVNHHNGMRHQYEYSKNNTLSSSFLQQFQCRRYTPFTDEEIEKEKARVSHLRAEEKDSELRTLNREISKLETLRAINTGELNSWRGRYKTLMREYAFPLFVYYWSIWSIMGMTVYLAIDFGGIDALALLAKMDTYTGWDLSSKVDPQLGKLGLVLMINEGLEPIRLPIVITTLKPVMDIVNPPKY